MSLLTLSEFSALGHITQDTLAITLDFDSVGLGKVKPYTEKAIRHVLGLWRPADDLRPISAKDWDAVFRDYATKIASEDKTGVQRDLYLLFVSGYIHEVRHAHDLLATCYGQNQLFRLLNCYQNIHYIFFRLREWQTKTGNEIPIPLPDSFEFDESAMNVVKKYRSVISEIRDLQIPKGTSGWLTATDVLEISACNAQLSFLIEMFGYEEAFRVTQLIAMSPNAHRYLRARSVVHDYTQTMGIREGVSSAALSYIAWASLMLLGQKDTFIVNGLNPAIAFEGILEKAIQTKKKIETSVAMNAVSSFCSEWQLRSPKEMQDAYTRLAEKRIDDLSSKAKYALTGRSVEVDKNENLANHVGFLKAFTHMKQLIEGTPNYYFDMSLYPWGLVSEVFPSVLVRTRSNGISTDFLSGGINLISYDNLSSIDFSGCSLRVLSEGFGSLSDSRAENDLFASLRSSSGFNYRFKDSFFDSCC